MQTFSEIFSAWIRYMLANPEQRTGQALFNYLYTNSQTKEFANSIRGTYLDPFHHDTRVPTVIATLAIRMQD